MFAHSTTNIWKNDKRKPSRASLHFHISTCPETNRRFLCENGVDNNIAEIFERDEKLQKVLDAYEVLRKAELYARKAQRVPKKLWLEMQRALA